MPPQSLIPWPVPYDLLPWELASRGLGSVQVHWPPQSLFPPLLRNRELNTLRIKAIEHVLNYSGGWVIVAHNLVLKLLLWNYDWCLYHYHLLCFCRLRDVLDCLQQGSWLLFTLFGRLLDYRASFLQCFTRLRSSAPALCLVAWDILNFGFGFLMPTPLGGSRHCNTFPLPFPTRVVSSGLPWKEPSPL